MKKKENNKALIRLLIPVIIAAAVICIFRSGYRTGHWLYEVMHK